ncbi:PD40 domain-containing protein [Bradymonas sediminis]|uniref:PD40 domain-containing protein n=1 Tax=Bradymonas sediminis TaxID=1548548 RepID=UPI0013A6E1A4|nr:PD40 domain-containing protein [Bradymonas sediminis]
MVAAVFALSPLTNGYTDDSSSEDSRSAEEIERDTSAYSGYLTWSRMHEDVGTTVWDLANMEARAHVGVNAYNELSGEARLSQNRKTLVYTLLLEQYTSFTGPTTVIVQDIETGAEKRYPSKIGTNGFSRIKKSPSISADGRRIALSQTDAAYESRPGTESLTIMPWSIQVWDIESDELIDVTTNDEASFGPDDIAPFISADGTRVLFLSSRDTRLLDFYMADVKENASVTRVRAQGEGFTPDLRGLYIENQISVSADLKWVLFLAETDYPDSLTGVRWNWTLLNTDTGDITHIDIVGADATDFTRKQLGNSAGAISADGSTLAFAYNFGTHDVSGQKVVVSSRETPSDLREIDVTGYTAQTGFGIALSSDGSNIAYTRENNQLWIRKTDGTNPKLVSTRWDDYPVSVEKWRGIFLSFTD